MSDGPVGDGPADPGDLFFAFIQDPTAQTYLPLREIVIASGKYDPYSSEFDGFPQLLESGRLDEARQRLLQTMPNLLLSPRAHLMIAAVAERNGDERAAETERLFASACAEGLLASGDGSQERPYLPLRTSDEHDLVQYLGKQFARQALVHKDERAFDVIECQDGTEMWFDITVSYGKLREKLG